MDMEDDNQLHHGSIYEENEDYIPYGNYLVDCLSHGQFFHLSQFEENLKIKLQFRLNVLGAASTHQRFFKLTDYNVLAWVNKLKSLTSEFYIYHRSSSTLVLLQCLWRYVLAADPDAYDRFTLNQLDEDISDILDIYKAEQLALSYPNCSKQNTVFSATNGNSLDQSIYSLEKIPHYSKQRYWSIDQEERYWTYDWKERQENPSDTKHELSETDSFGDQSESQSSNGDYETSRSSSRSGRQIRRIEDVGMSQDSEETKEIEECKGVDSGHWEDERFPEKSLKDVSKSFGYLIEHAAMPLCSILSTKAETVWREFRSRQGTARKVLNGENLGSDKERSSQWMNTSNPCKNDDKGSNCDLDEKEGFPVNCQNWEISPIELESNIEPDILLEILRLIILVKILKRSIDLLGSNPDAYVKKRREKNRPWIPEYLYNCLPTMFHFACKSLTSTPSSFKRDSPNSTLSEATGISTPQESTTRSEVSGNEGLAWKEGHRTVLQKEFKPVGTLQIQSDALLTLCHSLMPDKKRLRRCTFVFKKLNRIIKAYFGNEAEQFGSSCNGFETRSSDLDLMIPLKEGQRQYAKQEGKKRLFKVAARSGAVYVEDFGNKLEEFPDLTIKRVCSASVPVLKILKGFCPFEDISCDITFDNWLGVRNSALLRAYAESDTRARFLGILIKHWSRQRAINDSFSGTISSYGWTLMVIYFLQMRCPPLLPNLQSVLSSNRSPVSIEDQCHNCYFFDPPLTPYFSDTQNDPDVLVDLISVESGIEFPLRRQTLLPNGPPPIYVHLLLLEFFRFFTYEFNWYANVVSIRLTPRQVSKKCLFRNPPILPQIPKKRKKRKKKNSPNSSTKDLQLLTTATTDEAVVEEAIHTPEGNNLLFQSTTVQTHTIPFISEESYSTGNISMTPPPLDQKKSIDTKKVDGPLSNVSDSMKCDSLLFMGIQEEKSQDLWMEVETPSTTGEGHQPHVNPLDDFKFHNYSDLITKERQIGSYPWLSIDDPFHNGRVLKPSRKGMRRILYELHRGFELLSNGESFSFVVCKEVIRPSSHNIRNAISS